MLFFHCLAFSQKMAQAIHAIQYKPTQQSIMPNHFIIRNQTIVNNKINVDYLLTIVHIIMQLSFEVLCIAKQCIENVQQQQYEKAFQVHDFSHQPSMSIVCRAGLIVFSLSFLLGTHAVDSLLYQ